jgi:hypothetical protein
MRELAWNAQKIGKIEMPDPQYVDALDRRDLVDVLYAAGRFYLCD